MIHANDTLDLEKTDLTQEVARLREQYTDTQEIYREVCALLFFRHGVTPTANRLYQLVKKGSMSAPAEALSDFWKNIREKSRVRIDHPDIPAELNGVAGEVLGALWQQARRMAETNTEAIRSESVATSAAAEQAAALAKAEAVELAERLRVTESALKESQTRMGSLTEELSRERESRIATESRATRAEEIADELRRALAEAKEAAVKGIEERRLHLAEAEARHQVEIGRVRKELDAARREAEGWRKEHERANVNVAKHTGHQLARFAKLETELEAYRQKVILMEAAFADCKADREQVNTLLAGVIPLPIEMRPARKAKKVSPKRNRKTR